MAQNLSLPPWMRNLKLSNKGWNLLKTLDPSVENELKAAQLGMKDEMLVKPRGERPKRTLDKSSDKTPVESGRWIEMRPERKTDKKYRDRINRIIKHYQLQRACILPMGIAWTAYAIYRLIYCKPAITRRIPWQE